MCRESYTNVGKLIFDNGTYHELTDSMVQVKSDLLIKVVITALTFCLLMMLLHRVLMPLMFRARFENLTVRHQLIAIHHITECVTGLYVTFVMAHTVRKQLLCEPQWFFKSMELTCSMEASMSIVILYCLEISARLEDMRLITILHHALTVLYMILALTEINELTSAMGFITILFAGLEFPLYFSLLSYRLYSDRPLQTLRLMHVGIGIYGFTRLLQIFLHIVVLHQHFEKNSHRFGDLTYVLTLGFLSFLDILQLFTFKIYWTLSLRVKRAAREASDVRNGDDWGPDTIRGGTSEKDESKSEGASSISKSMKRRGSLESPAFSVFRRTTHETTASMQTKKEVSGVL